MHGGGGDNLHFTPTKVAMESIPNHVLVRQDN